MSQTSLSFDHAADFYDATRALPDEVRAALTEAILRALAAARCDRLLEVGTGTGRIARPLTARGVRVCGVDIAPRMLARFRAQMGPRDTAPDLILADATCLPFRIASHPAVLVSHVLHLIPPWEAALAEMLRVLRPGGVFLSTSEENASASDWDAGADKWNELLAARGFVRRKRPDSAAIAAVLTAAGGSCRSLTAAEWDETSTPAEELDLDRRRIHSWNWEIPDEIFFACLPEVERWAAEHYGSLDRPLYRRAAQRLQVWSFA